MSDLEKVVYLADMTEYGRFVECQTDSHFEALRAVLTAVYLQGLDKGMAAGLQYSVDSIAIRGLEVYHRTNCALQYYTSLTAK
jgi:HD superfamily phosphohydrolase YqeK